MEFHRNSAARHSGYPVVDRRAAETARHHLRQPRAGKPFGAVLRSEVTVQDTSHEGVQVNGGETATGPEVRTTNGIPYAGQDDGQAFDVNATRVPSAFWTEGQV